MAAVSALEAESELVLTLTLMCGEKEVLDTSVVELGWCSYWGHVVMRDLFKVCHTISILLRHQLTWMPWRHTPIRAPSIRKRGK